MRKAMPLRRRLIGLAACTVVLAGCGSSPLVPPAVVRALAPSGTLRAAINYGNPILARRDDDGQPMGVSVDLARNLAARLGVPVQLIPFESAGKVVEAGRNNGWDLAFVAIDPLRGQDLLQTNPYVIIEGAYLVRADSPIRRNEDVDRDGIRIAVGRGSAYDLHLSRELKRARIVYAPTSPAVTDLFVEQKLDVAAGVRQQLEADAQRLPGLRVLEGRFMVIQQAMATPRGREAGARYLNEFVESMKATGFVAQALQRHGIQGAAVAPPGGPR